ncbi:MAG TPA: hypothetical protein VG755_26615 [Nannocystaceae bacterium]|nr:hypothetical protein [Nannocystaceae bacterium]
MARLLALLLALLASLPTQAWAGLADVCGEPDRCCCRAADREDDPVARRPDCCETPCTTDAVPSPATPVRSDSFAAIPTSAALAITRVEVERVTDAEAPRARPRGPPPRWFGRVAHRLL